MHPSVRKAENRRQLLRKLELVRLLKAERGGSCERCGYSACLAALHFHHTSPATKEFQVSSTRVTSLYRTRRESDKCELICANCHAEETHSEF